MADRKSVFLDSSGRRRRLLRVVTVVAATFFSIAGVSFFAALAINHPSTPTLPAAMTMRGLPVPRTAASEAERLALEVKDRELEVARSAHVIATKTKTTASPTDATGKPLSVGFYVNWDDRSLASLTRNIDKLDWVVPSWMTLTGTDMTLTSDVEPNVTKMIADRKPDLSILPMVQNADDGVWDGAGLAKLLADPVKSQQRVSDIVSVLTANHFQGVTIDFEEVPASAQRDMQTFLKSLHESLASQGMKLLVTVPFDDDDWDYAAYSQIADDVVLMAYDEHEEGSDAGPIASQDWFERILDKRMTKLDPAHTIIGLGNYAYDWSKGAATQDLTFAEAMLTAKDFGS